MESYFEMILTSLCRRRKLSPSLETLGDHSLLFLCLPSAVNPARSPLGMYPEHDGSWRRGGYLGDCGLIFLVICQHFLLTCAQFKLWRRRLGTESSHAEEL